MNTLNIKVNGKTRSIAIRDMGDGFAMTEHVFACRIGRGAKLHRTAMWVVIRESIEELRKLGYRTLGHDIIEQNGVFYGLQMNCVVRNRNAYIVAWADEVANTEAATKQKYYGSC